MISVAIRADASTQIGSGHVVRCATLAQVLRARGARIVFICRELPGNACDWLSTQGFEVFRLPAALGESRGINSTDDAIQSQAVLAAYPGLDWLVVDHYQLDAAWELKMRAFAKRVLVIDDLADRPHDCDVLLDQNLRDASSRPYSDLLPAKARILLGPRYALLRPEFAEQRKVRVTPRRGNGPVRRIFVCFGGSDPKNHTAHTLQGLIPHCARLDRIDVVIGNANPHREQLCALIAAHLPTARLHVQISDIAPLLAAADLAIGAGGTMNWERACLGVPSLVFGIAENQTPGLSELISQGYVAGVPEMLAPDPALIEAWINCIIDNAPLLDGLRKRSASLTDGDGGKRVADEILAAPLAFRPATMDDCDAILAWRNSPEVRRVSLQEGKIDPADHRSWLEATLSNPRRILLIAEAGGIPAGVVRFDLAPPEAIISIYRTPMAPPRCGLIRQASAWLGAAHPEIRRIVAEILPDNAASLSAFQNAGYRPIRNILGIETEKL